MPPGRSLGKIDRLNGNDLADFVARQANFEETGNSWPVDVADIDPDSVDLSVKSDNKATAEPLRDFEVIINERRTWHFECTAASV